MISVISELKDPHLNSAEHTRLACLFRRLAETDGIAECETKFTNTRGACAPYNLRPTRAAATPETVMSCRGLVSPGSSFYSRLILWVQAIAFSLCGASIVSNVESYLHSLKGLWLTVNEVVHHDDIMTFIVVRARGHVASLDQDRRDAGVVKLNSKEGQVSIAW